MLTPEEIEEIKGEFDMYGRRQAAAVEALKVVQQHRGWVSDEALRDLADLLQMSPAELDAVATFYNEIFRKPVGRHLIRVCNSVSCWIMGCDALIGRLKERLGIDVGGTTADGRFTLLPHVCLGICHHAPAMMIDDDLYEDIAVSDLDRILAGYE